MADPIKILASRFVSLPYYLRMEIAGKLLRWREEAQDSARAGMPGKTLDGQRRKSFMEQFWDEVEKSHADNLYPRNPFAEAKLRFGQIDPLSI
jgi:hypothetical protein